MPERFRLARRKAAKARLASQASSTPLGNRHRLNRSIPAYNTRE